MLCYLSTMHLKYIDFDILKYINKINISELMYFEYIKRYWTDK